MGASDMRLMMLLAVCVSSLLIGATPALAKSQREKATLQFEAMWNQRLVGYRTQAATTATKHKAAFEAIASGSPFVFADGDPRFSQFVDASDANAYVGGRGEELEAFLAQLKSRQSVGLLQAYLQGRVQWTEGLAAVAERERLSLMAISKAEGTAYGKLFEAAERASMARGDAAGRTDEMVLIIQNLGPFMSDLASATQADSVRRARIGAALRAIGQSLNRPTYQVHCVRTGPFTNCTGQ